MPARCLESGDIDKGDEAILIGGEMFLNALDASTCTTPGASDGYLCSSGITQ